ncbi:MAG: hypothetical protein EOO13_10505 [Chitinophagaceae bacterium]|nr:MAG: hypothetical protein EOO13_10505 [Chitinophagaceae bacterium]
MKRLYFMLLAFMLGASAIAQKKSLKITISTLDQPLRLTGRLMAVSDSNITLNTGDSDLVYIPVKNMKWVRIKNSFGSNALIAGGSAGVTFALVGLAIGQEKKNDGTLGGALQDAFTPTKGEAASLGLVNGLMLGTAFAGIQSAVRGKMKFEINGSQENWKVALKKIQSYMSKP